MRRAGFGRLRQARIDGKIKRIFDPRALWSQSVCLHIGFCKFPRHLLGTKQGLRVPPFSSSLLISIFRAMAPAMCVDDERRYLFASMRAGAI
jgi:hypothetical protein